MCVCVFGLSQCYIKAILKIVTCISTVVVMGICTDCTVMCTITKCNFKVQIV